MIEDTIVCTKPDNCPQTVLLWQEKGDDPLMAPRQRPLSKTKQIKQTE